MHIVNVVICLLNMILLLQNYKKMSRFFFNKRNINWTNLTSDNEREKLWLKVRICIYCTRQDSILNLIFSSEHGIIYNVEMGELFGYVRKFYNDHRIIICDRVVKVPMHIDNSRVYDKLESHTMKNVIYSNIQYSDRLLSFVWIKFRYRYRYINEKGFQTHIPLKIIKIRKKPVWMDSRAFKAMKGKTERYDFYKKHQTEAARIQ